MATVQEHISAITANRNTIRNKLVDFGLAESTSQLAALATAIDGIANNGTVAVEVKEGETYTIKPGYHKGGTVAGVAGGGNYTLQEKSVSPTKQAQSVASDEGYYGLSAVNVAAIPEAYQDVTAVTAGAADVLANKVIVDSAGAIVAGTMPNNGAVSKTLDASTASYTVPKGYHDGTGKVQVVAEAKSATPTEDEQVISATAGKVLSSVTVAAIPSDYIVTADADAAAADILIDKTAYVDGVKVEGTMANNGAVAKTLDTATTSYTVPAGYHDGMGAVSVSLETKSATPTKSAQTVKPSTGKVLSQVTVAAIPDAYQDVTATTATAATVLAGSKFVDASGTVVTGTMADNGVVSETIDGLTVTSVDIPAGYTAGGTVSLTDDIAEALAAI